MGSDERGVLVFRGSTVNGGSDSAIFYPVFGKWDVFLSNYPILAVSDGIVKKLTSS